VENLIPSDEITALTFPLPYSFIRDALVQSHQEMVGFAKPRNHRKGANALSGKINSINASTAVTEIGRRCRPMMLALITIKFQL
jgi:hypothetical protein